jgi:demethylmenaquinone methyltransferase/2-methoxy-6-polyprenyl-1,4-benzoquinol methylase
VNPAELYRWRAPVYDLELLPFEPLRRAAIAALDLQPGQTVLDLGCGTGLSLDLLQQAVGPSGRIIAIEQSAPMLARARQRVQAAGWRNVELIEAPVAQAAWRGPPADAALFLFTHDILQDDAALRRVLARLRPGARLAAAGLAWAPAWALPANLFVLGAALYSVSALQGLDAPWARLQALAGPLALRQPPGFFIAAGRSGHHRQE